MDNLGKILQPQIFTNSNVLMFEIYISLPHNKP